MESASGRLKDGYFLSVTGPWRCVLLAHICVQCCCNGDTVCFPLVCREAETLQCTVGQDRQGMSQPWEGGPAILAGDI